MKAIARVAGWGAGAGLALLVYAGGISAAPRAQTTPLAEPNLFISPSGQPFRSKAGEPYPVVAWFNKVDANHDGKIDKAEFRAEAEDFFHQLDVHKTGVISDDVIDFYEKQVVPEINTGIDDGSFGAEKKGDDDKTTGPPPDAGPRGASLFGLTGDPEPIRSADYSLRSQITLKDMLRRADYNFGVLDRKERGYLTLDDLPRPPAEVGAESARRRRP